MNKPKPTDPQQDTMRIGEAPFLVTFQKNQYSRREARFFWSYEKIPKFIDSLHKKDVWLHQIWKIDCESTSSRPLPPTPASTPAKICNLPNDIPVLHATTRMGDCHYCTKCIESERRAAADAATIAERERAKERFLFSIELDSSEYIHPNTDDESLADKRFFHISVTAEKNIESYILTEDEYQRLETAIRRWIQKTFCRINRDSLRRQALPQEQPDPCPKCGGPTFTANVDNQETRLCMNDACKWKGPVEQSEGWLK